METVIAALVTGIVTLIGAWMVHRREVKKEKTASEVAVAAVYSQMRLDFEKHAKFMREILDTERKEHETERLRHKLVMQELDDCLDKVRKVK